MSSEQHQQKRRKTEKSVGNANMQERKADRMEDTSQMPNNLLEEMQSTSTLRHRSAPRNDRNETSRSENALQNSVMNANVTGGSQHNYNLRSRSTGNNNSGIRVNKNPLQSSSMRADIFEEMMRHPLFGQPRTSQIERNERPATSSMHSIVVEDDQRQQNVGQHNISETRRPGTSLPSNSANSAVGEENEQPRFLGQSDRHETRNHGNPLQSSSASLTISRRGSNGNLENISSATLDMPCEEEKTFNYGEMSLEEFVVNFCQLSVSLEKK